MKPEGRKEQENRSWVHSSSQPEEEERDIRSGREADVVSKGRWRDRRLTSQLQQRFDRWLRNDIVKVLRETASDLELRTLKNLLEFRKKK